MISEYWFRLYNGCDAGAVSNPYTTLHAPNMLSILTIFLDEVSLNHATKFRNHRIIQAF